MSVTHDDDTFGDMREKENERVPLRPTSPYRRPAESFSDASTRRSFPAKFIVNCGITMSFKALPLPPRSMSRTLTGSSDADEISVLAEDMLFAAFRTRPSNSSIRCLRFSIFFSLTGAIFAMTA